MTPIWEDKLLMRIKDILLILGILWGALGWAGRAQSLPESVLHLEDVTKRHETALAVIDARYTEIIRRLDRIETKLR